MSDLRKIIESRKAQREAAPSPERRQILAIEDCADALEGIRIDLTLLSGQLTHLVNAVGRLTPK